MDYITLYGRKYARTKALLTKTLFEPTGTANGIFKIVKSGIFLCDLSGEKRVFIRKDGVGPVTARRLENGRIRYMFSTTDRDRVFIGEPASYMARVEGANELVAELSQKGTW